MQTVAPLKDSKSKNGNIGFLNGKTGMQPFFPATIIQPKLVVGPSNDPYETEADVTAERVMRMTSANNEFSGDSDNNNYSYSSKSGTSTFLQRQCTACEKEELQRKLDHQSGENHSMHGNGSNINNYSNSQNIIQRKCAECEKEELVQRKEVEDDEPELKNPEQENVIQPKCDVCNQDEKIQTKTEGTVASAMAAPPIVNEVVGSSGNPLDPGTRNFFESRFNNNFSSVRVHNDHNAHKSSASINAQAYTFNNHIVFGAGKYSPNSFEGKKLLAHELTHVIQQTGNAVRRKEDEKAALPKPSVCGPVKVVTAVTSEPAGDAIEAGVENKPKDSTVTPSTPQSHAVNPKSNSSALPGNTPTKSTGDANLKGSIAKRDPEFQQFKNKFHKLNQKQKKTPPAADKAKEGESSVNVPGEKEITDGAHLINVSVESAAEPKTEFNAQAFKDSVKKRILVDFPETSEAKKKFEQDKEANVGRINKQVLPEMQKAQAEYVDTANQINSAPASIDEEKKKKFTEIKFIESKPEDAGKKPGISNIEQATPKPLQPDELKMDEPHNADSLDTTMAEHQMTDNQLAESQEKQFLDTLEEKQTAQKELCKVTETMQTAEQLAAENNLTKAKGSVNSSLSAMHGTKQQKYKDVQNSKDGLKDNDEKLLQDYYATITGIFNNTKECVSCILSELTTEVEEEFRTAVESAYKDFKEYVEEELDDYYGADLLIVTVGNSDEVEDNLLKMVNKEVDDQIKNLQQRARNLDPNSDASKKLDEQILNLKSKRKKLNIEVIFEKGKSQFIAKLDEALDKIAKNVAEKLNLAKAKIQEGRSKVDVENKKCPDSIKEKATERTLEIQASFTDLEGKLTEKENDLVESISKQYNENVGKLKETFEKIREEASLKWWQRAWRKIKEIATIIFQIGKLLFKIVVKAAGVIGDIIAHPIRFFGNLIDAVSLGFKNFIKNIGKHLEDIIFKLILGVIPPGLTLPEQWDAKGIFSFVLGFFGLSKENIRLQAVTKFGEPVVAQLEKAFDLFVIFKNEGFAGLWEHVKGKIGDIKNAIIEEVKTFFKESIIKAAIEFLLSALTPASGFIKVCKAIIGIVTFFIKNLVNILKLLDSILDSFADMVAGRIAGAAKRVESALADILLIGIKFLAALVGINLDKIQSKISKIINAVRNPVNRAIQWFLDKAQAFAEKTGLLKLIRKANQKIEGGKEWVNEKVEKAKQGAIDLKDKLVNWALSKITFKDENGKGHKLYVKEVNGNPLMTVESTPDSVENFLDHYIKTMGPNIPQTKMDLIVEARTLLNGDIKDKMKEIKKTGKGGAEEKKLMQELLQLEVKLSGFLKQLLGDTKSFAGDIKKYELEGLSGTYESMPKPVGDELTADHQPQAAILVYAVSLSPFKEAGITKLKTRAEKRAHKGYAINLHKNRHIKGRTYGSDGGETKKEFVKEAQGIMKLNLQPATKRKRIVDIIKSDLEADVKEMRSVAKQKADHDSWKDIPLKGKAKEEMVKDISKRILAGEDKMINQPVEELEK